MYPWRIWQSRCLCSVYSVSFQNIILFFLQNRCWNGSWVAAPTRRAGRHKCRCECVRVFIDENMCVYGELLIQDHEDTLKPVAQWHQMVSGSLALLYFYFWMRFSWFSLGESRAAAQIGEEKENKFRQFYWRTNSHILSSNLNLPLF